MIGDAAGFTDPMTGEGIHTAMDSGRMAASVIEDALTVGNFDAAIMEEYQNRWLNAWGTDFYWLVRLCVCVLDNIYLAVPRDVLTLHHINITHKGNKTLLYHVHIL